MALSHSPQIVTDGLAFYYDMGNSQKSFRGAPTTNLIVTTPIGFGIYAYVSNPVSVSTNNENSTAISARRYNITNAINFARASINPSIAVGQTYTFSYKIRYNGSNTSSPSFYADATKGNPEASGGNTLSGITQTQTALRNGWFYVRYTFTVSASVTNAAILAYGVVTGSDAAYVNNTFDIYEEQFEVGNIPSAYANGTRSNIESILDLTNNNTVTATSLTYAADGTFSFNGSSNLAVFPENSIFNSQNHSVEVWIRTNATTQNGFWFEKGNVNTQYSLFQEGANIQWRHSYTDGVLDSQSTTTANFINTNNWAQVVGAYGGGLKRTYINGVLVNSRSESRTVSTNTNGCSIGVYGGFNGSRSYFYNGNIGIVKVYNKALSASEVQQNFNALRGRYGI